MKFGLLAFTAFSLSLSACSNPEPATEEGAIAAVEAAAVDEPEVIDKRFSAERRTACDLRLIEQKRVFQAFVRLDDVNGGSDNHDATVKDIGRIEGLSKDCVETIIRIGISRSDWIPEPTEEVVRRKKSDLATADSGLAQTIDDAEMLKAIKNYSAIDRSKANKLAAQCEAEHGPSYTVDNARRVGQCFIQNW